MTIDNKFNKASDEGTPAPVVAYADAGPKLKAEMEKLMEPIDRTPGSFETVVSFGHPVFERLSKGTVTPAEVAVYLGAGDEVLRRYNQEYIPKAKKQFADSQNPEDDLFLKAVIKRKEDFIDRITVLDGLHAAALIGAQERPAKSSQIKPPTA